jgi:ankyrin repeat protein
VKPTASCQKHSSMSDDEEQQCTCKSLKDAALSAHLPCLKKYWRESIDDKLRSELLDSVAHHRHLLWAKTSTAATHGRDCTACLRVLLKAGIKISVVFEPEQQGYDHRRHPLSSAAAGGCVACIQTILDSIESAQQAIPVELWQYAVKNAVSALRFDALKALLAAAPDEYSSELQQYALIEACSTHPAKYASKQEKHAECTTTVRAILELLLESGDVDINAACAYQDDEKKQQWSTALSCLIKHGCVDGVQWLVEVAGADVNSTWGDYKHSALHAVSNRWHSDHDTSVQLIETLTELGVDINMTTSSGATVLHTAALNQNSTVLKALVELCNSNRTETPLIAHQDNQGETPIHAVIEKEAESWQKYPRTELVGILLNCNDVDVAEALMTQDKAGHTVLHCAILERQLEVVSQLLDASSDLGMLDTLLSVEDKRGQSVIKLVRRMGGDSLMSVVMPYCAEVRHSLQEFHAS